MRSKVLQIIERLLEAEAVPVIDPRTGRPTGQVRPTIMPDKSIDDFTVLKQVVRQYCQENSDLPDDNPAGWQNLLAYFTAAVALETQQMAEMAQQKAVVAQAGSPKAPQIPPHETDDVVHTVGGLMHTPPSATSGNIQGQVQAANTLIKLADKLQTS
jgi:hypothetical protein